MIYGLQWVITFLSYDMPFESLVLVWDQLVLFGPAIIYQTILGIFHTEEETILSLGFETCLRKLKRKCNNNNMSAYKS